MFILSRELHCALAGMDVEAFKTLQRYGRLPSLPDAFRADKGFGPLETLALATFNVMVEQHHVAREHAAAVCSGAGIMATRWEDIRKTSEELARGHAQKSEILFGRVTLPFPGKPSPAIGTLEEIAAEHRTAISIIAVSVSRVAASLRSRAAQRKVHLEEFWADPAVTRELRPAADAPRSIPRRR